LYGNGSLFSVTRESPLPSFEASATRYAGFDDSVGWGFHKLTLYNPDGTIHGSSADGAYQGKWHIDGDTLCLEYDEPLGCRKIALDGDKVTYITEEGEIDGSGTLIKGNPNHY
jgi:hypothetical protein